MYTRAYEKLRVSGVGGWRRCSLPPKGSVPLQLTARHSLWAFGSAAVGPACSNVSSQVGEFRKSLLGPTGLAFGLSGFEIACQGRAAAAGRLTELRAVAAVAGPAELTLALRNWVGVSNYGVASALRRLPLERFWVVLMSFGFRRMFVRPTASRGFW